MLSGGGFNLTMKSQNSDHTSFVVQKCAFANSAGTSGGVGDT